MRAILHKKIYPQGSCSTTPFIKKYLEATPISHFDDAEDNYDDDDDEELATISENGSKWVKTDSECKLYYTLNNLFTLLHFTQCLAFHYIIIIFLLQILFLRYDWLLLLYPNHSDYACSTIHMEDEVLFLLFWMYESCQGKLTNRKKNLEKFYVLQL